MGGKYIFIDTKLFSVMRKIEFRLTMNNISSVTLMTNPFEIILFSSSTFSSNFDGGASCFASAYRASVFLQRKDPKYTKGEFYMSRRIKKDPKNKNHTLARCIILYNIRCITSKNPLRRLIDIFYIRGNF